MSLKQNDLVSEEYIAWLEENGVSYGDVMSDEKGKFVMVDGEEGYDRVDLPAKFADLKI